MKKLQFGRSMIEMLGVLAIIGVLSIGGMSMYRKAILNYQLGQTQHWIEMARMIMAEACMNGNQDICSSGYSADAYKQRAAYVCFQGGTSTFPSGWSTGYGSLRTALQESALLLRMDGPSNLLISFKGLDKNTCRAVINYNWNGLMHIKNESNGNRMYYTCLF